MHGSDTYFLEVSAHVSMTVATKGFYRGKTFWKFYNNFSKTKSEECNLKNSSVFDKFVIIKPC